MKIFFSSLLLILFITFSAKSEIVKKIEVNGNQRVSSETIKIFSEVKLDSDLNLNDLNDVIKKIYSTNFFNNVKVNLIDNILIIDVEENPIIQTLKFDGVKNKLGIAIFTIKK